MRRASIAVLVSCAAFAVGCGGAEDEETAATPAPAESQTAPTEEPATDVVPEDEVEVTMVNFEFVPRDVTVEQGQTITWVNEDTAQHNAVAREGEGPQSELFNQGETYSWTADVEPGEIPYVCTIHPGMEGTITVR
jgi:plastocyanin